MANKLFIYLTLSWYNSLTNCSGMFRDVDSVVSVDLSEFDFSQVVDMSFMFKNWINLKNINFGNNLIQRVKSMDSMFYGCKSLSRLDFQNLILNLLQLWKIYFMNAID